MTVTGDLPVVAEMLSDAAVAAELERRRIRLASAVAGGDAAATVPALSWSLAGALFATPLTAISGVGAMPRVTAVPGAPAALIGIFGRHGVINSLFDPGMLLGVGPGAAGGAVILLRGTRPRIAIRVDAVLAVVDVPLAGGDDAGAIGRIVMPADDLRLTLVDTARLIGQLTDGRQKSPVVEG